MCQTLDAVFQPRSHLLSSYKKYGLRLVFRWFRDFVYSCDHQTTLYKTLNNRHTPPLKSEPKKISLRSIKNHPLLKIWISDENTASPVRYITYSSHWLVYSTSPAKIVQTPLSVSAGPDIWRCVRYFDLWGIHEEISRMKHCMPCLI